MMAIGLARYRFRGKGLYRGMAYLPLIIPDIAIAVATLVFLASMAIPLSLWTIIAAHMVFLPGLYCRGGLQSPAEP